jgi:hypothetical protein
MDATTQLVSVMDATTQLVSVMDATTQLVSVSKMGRHCQKQQMVRSRLFFIDLIGQKTDGLKFCFGCQNMRTWTRHCLSGVSFPLHDTLRWPFFRCQTKNTTTAVS